MSTFTFGLLDNYRGAAVVLDCFVLRQFMSFLILFSKRVVRAVGGGEVTGEVSTPLFDR